MADFQVVPLLCPTCGAPLAGLEHDRVFFCVPCKQGVTPKNGDWIKRPLLTPVMDVPGQTRIVYLPFWQLKVAAAAECVNKPQEVAARLLPQFTTVFVAGFTLVRASYFGDIGLAYTEKMVQLKAAEDFPARLRVAGCTRDVDEAARYAELFITLILDKRADVTGMRINIQVQGARLWAVPFADEGNQIRDLALGLTLPVFAVDDLEELRKLVQSG